SSSAHASSSLRWRCGESQKCSTSSKTSLQKRSRLSRFPILIPCRTRPPRMKRLRSRWHLQCRAQEPGNPSPRLQERRTPRRQRCPSPARPQRYLPNNSHNIALQSAKALGPQEPVLDRVVLGIAISLRVRAPECEGLVQVDLSCAVIDR